MGGLAPWAEGSLGLCRWQPRVHRELTLVSTANILFILIVYLILIIFLILITPLSSSKPSFFFFFLPFYSHLAKKAGRGGSTQNPKKNTNNFPKESSDKDSMRHFLHVVFSRDRRRFVCSSLTVTHQSSYPPPLFDL